MKSTYREKKDPPKLKVRISFIILFIIFSFSLCFVLFMKDRGTFLSEDLVTRLFPPKGTEDTVKKTDTSVLNPLKAKAALDRDYLESCVFVGNEICGSLAPDGAATVIFDSGTDRMYLSRIETESGKHSVKELVKDTGAENVYILFGAQSLHLSNSSIAENAERFAEDMISSGKRVYIVSSMPATNGDTERDTEIERINRLLLESANHCGAYYIDASLYFKKSDGHISAVYVKDGLFNERAKGVFEKTVLTHYADTKDPKEMRE